MKCDLCSKNMEETFLGKTKGGIVKIKEKDRNKLYHVCPECQKQYKEKTKQELIKKIT